MPQASVREPRRRTLVPDELTLAVVSGDPADAPLDDDPHSDFPYSADEALAIRRVQDVVAAFCARMPNPVHAAPILRAAQSDEALAAHDAQQFAEHTRS